MPFFAEYLEFIPIKPRLGSIYPDVESAGILIAFSRVFQRVTRCDARSVVSQRQDDAIYKNAVLSISVEI